MRNNLILSVSMEHVAGDKKKDFQETVVGNPLEDIKFVLTIFEKYHLHGHGVSSQQDAETIINQGLFTRGDTLQDFTHTLPEDAKDFIKTVQGWKYEARKFIILIAVPKVEEYYASDAASEEATSMENRNKSKSFAAKHVFDIPHDSTQSDFRNHLSSKHIIGYWDGNQKKFIKNKNFTIS